MYKILKKIIFCVTLLFLSIGIALAEETTGYDDLIDNTTDPKGGDPFHYCDTCQYTTPDYPAGATTVQVTTSGGNIVEVTVCSEYAALFVDNCDIISDDYPTPLNPDGSTNEDYHEFWNDWFDKAIENGELNLDSQAGKMISEAFCTGEDGINPGTPECAEKIKDMVGASADDEMDAVAYPSQVVCTGTGITDCTLINDLVTDLCGGSLPGVNKLLCENVGGACLAGSGTDYQSENKQIEKGDAGACTYDSFAQQFDTGCLVTCIKMYKGDEAAISACYEKMCKKPEPKPNEPQEPDPIECPTYTCEEIYGKEGCNPSSVELPPNYTKGGTCGNNYSSKTYEWSDGFVDSCNTTKYIIETDASVEVPGPLRKPALAGQGFNWGGFNGTVTVTKKIEGSAKLAAEKNKVSVEKMNIDVSYECQEKEIEKEATTGHANCTSSYKSCSNAAAGDSAKQTECSTEETNCHNGVEASKESALKKLAELQEDDQKYKELEKKLEELEKCSKEIENFKTTIDTYTGFPSGKAKMILDNGYEQVEGDTKSIIKNSGFASKESLLDEAFTNDYDFFIPSTIMNAKGTLNQSISNSFFHLDVSCPLSVTNYFIEPSGINVIYRPISLINPFPQTNSTGEGFRKTVGYWTEGVANMIVLNNREVENYAVYSLQPMYTIILTPSDIKEIRKYNDTTEYNDFRMKCENGLYCRSNFLWGFDSSYTNFNRLVDYNNSCAMDTEWYSCDSDYYASARDNLLNKLK